jgi:predicted ATPase
LGNLRTAFASLADAHYRLGQSENGLTLVAEALTREPNCGGRRRIAELYQLNGQLLLLNRSSNSTEAEKCFRQAIVIARSQGYKWQELTATTDLARFLKSDRRSTEALATLSEIYNWFTEGFDTTALKEAKFLLDELNRRTPLQA